MSLQVWLPFTKDINNQGLSNNTFNNNNVTIASSGKLGNCGSFNGNNSYLYSSYKFYNNKYSVCAWFYSTSSTQTQTICCDRTAVGSGFSIFLIGGKLRIDPGGNNLQWTTNYTYPINTWTHLAVIYDGTNVFYYINGEFKEKKAQTISVNYWGNITSIGASQANGSSYGNYLNGNLNDIRIYNHALSTKEVKELAKGLVLHYKLDSPKTFMPNTLGNENLLIGTGYSQDVIDSMVGDSSTDWTRPFRWYNGSKAIHTFSDGVDTIRLNATGNLGIAFARKATDINLDSSSYYTLSCEAKCTKSGAQLGIGTSYYKNNNSWIWRGGANKFSFSAVDTWQTFKYTFKPNADTQYICYCFTCANGTSGGTDTFSIRHCKLEKGSTATAWQLNPAEEGYSTSIIPDNMWNIEYDCSGYNNNASVIGSLTAATDTSRYDFTAHFGSTATKVKISNLDVTGFADTYSIAWWGKVPTYSGKMMWGFTDGSKLNGIYNGTLWNTGDSSSNPLYKPGTTTQVSAPTTNTWHHFVMTGNGSKCQVYQDGKLWGVAKTYKSLSGTTIYMNGWNTATTYTYDNLSLSDFRIYSTSLTAEDVLELYNTSASIDNNGNGYAREIIENNGNVNITKAGQWRVNELIDDNGNTTASITKANKELKVNTFYEY